MAIPIDTLENAVKAGNDVLHIKISAPTTGIRTVEEPPEKEESYFTAISQIADYPLLNTISSLKELVKEIAEREQALPRETVGHKTRYWDLITDL